MWARIKPSISSALISVRPSLWACSATAIATAADTSRSDVTGGSKLPLGFALISSVLSSNRHCAFVVGPGTLYLREVAKGLGS